MDDMIGSILLIGMLCGLEIVAVFILILSTIYGGQVVFVILCGVSRGSAHGGRVSDLVDL
jgi:hypothetical protein